LSGPLAKVSEENVACLEFDELGENKVMRYLELAGWEEEDNGRRAALALEAVSKVLEYRLLRKDRELEKDEYEEAFLGSDGLLITIPLLQSPTAFSEHALLCVAVIAQANSANVANVAAFSSIHTVLGFPSPQLKPMPSHVRGTLKTSMAARRSVAKILALCMDTQVAMDLLQESGDVCVKEIVKLTLQVRADGKGSLEAFRDMLHVLYIVAEERPEQLCRRLPEEMLNILVDLSLGKQDELPTFYAGAIVKAFKRDPKSEAIVLPIIQRAEPRWTKTPRLTVDSSAESTVSIYTGSQKKSGPSAKVVKEVSMHLNASKVEVALSSSERSALQTAVPELVIPDATSGVSEGLKRTELGIACGDGETTPEAMREHHGGLEICAVKLSMDSDELLFSSNDFAYVSADDSAVPSAATIRNIDLPADELVVAEEAQLKPATPFWMLSPPTTSSSKCPEFLYSLSSNASMHDDISIVGLCSIEGGENIVEDTGGVG